MQEWFEAIQRQIDFWSHTFEERAKRGLRSPVFDTIFLGGGTPSLLENDLLVAVGLSLAEKLPLAKRLEFTVECNPETLSLQKLEALHAMGANRLSVGIQSFDNTQLERLERRARREHNELALELLSQKWSGRWSMDLMFGLPGQNAPDWKSQLETALAFKPQHISAYQLTLTTERSKSWKQSSEEGLLEMFDEVENRMAQSGLERYEVSNFAVPGQESQHNLKYWRLEPFLGLGPGASGLISPTFLPENSAPADRFGFHQKQPDRFEVWAESCGRANSELESHLKKRDVKDHLFEMLMMGLRLKEGVQRARLSGLQSAADKEFETLQRLEFAEIAANSYRMKPKGLRILDSLLPRLFAQFEKDAGQNLDLLELDPTFV